MPRSYANSKRAAAAAATKERIISATEVLLAADGAASVTLQAIAERSGVTAQTVLRHLGSRDGCLEAVRERVRARIANQRGESEPGDIRSAIAGLIQHYEAEGRLILRLLSDESSDAFSAQAVAAGRAYHRAWVQRCFGPHLSPSEPATSVDALVVATDLSVWRLLRLDLHRSAEETSAVMTRLVRAVLGQG